MQDDDTPRAAGGARVPARHLQAPLGRGWDPIERCDWEAVAAVLPTPWPPGAQRHDLRYWSARERLRAGNRPGYRELAARWGVTEKAARLVCADVSWWADPRFGDEHPEREEQRGRSGAQQGRSRGAAGAHEGRSKGAPDHDGAAVLDAKRAGQGQARGAAGAHEGRSKGAAGAPIDDRDSDRDTNSHTDRESMSGAAAPSPAGAGQLSLLSGQVEPVKPARPSKAAREVEAAEDLLRRLDAMRLDRHRGGRPLKPETWLPEVRRALKRQSPQEVIDGWTWMLRSPEAAWHRAEDGKGQQDRTKDLKALLAHPEYAERRSWRGLEGAHEHDLEPRGEAPAVQVVTPLMAAREQRERQEEAERQAWIAEQAAVPAVLLWEEVAEPEPPPAPPPLPPAAPVRPLRERLLEDRAAAAEARDGWLAELEAANAAHEQAKAAQAAERRAGGPPFGPAAREVAAAQNRRVVAQQQLDAIALALVHLEARLAAEVT
jgi:hypothetical protein